MARTESSDQFRDAFMRDRRAQHPALWEAISADARITASYRGEPPQSGSGLAMLREVIRLAVVSDAFAAQALYRVKARLQARGVPLLPRIAHRLAMALGQVSIGDPVVVHSGVYIVHGQVVIDGITEIHTGVSIAPFVTIGLRAGDFAGPTVERDVSIGTGAKVLGNISVGAGARIGANAVVIDDVAEGATVVGAPARPVGPNGA
jgi:serine O-acetyltransferase